VIVLLDSSLEKDAAGCKNECCSSEDWKVVENKYRKSRELIEDGENATKGAYFVKTETERERDRAPGTEENSYPLEYSMR
jgi:hypothetical protein